MNKGQLKEKSKVNVIHQYPNIDHNLEVNQCYVEMINTSLEQIRSVQSEIWDEIYYEPTGMKEEAELKIQEEKDQAKLTIICCNIIVTYNYLTQMESPLTRMTSFFFSLMALFCIIIILHFHRADSRIT
jgi:hypothetical protein